MAKQFDYEVKTTIRLNMHNPDHVLINNVIQNLDPKIFKSKNQFILDACKFYIDNYGSETFIAKKKDNERAEYIRSEDIEDIKAEVIEAAINEARKEVIKLLGGVISGMNVGQPVIMQQFIFHSLFESFQFWNAHIHCTDNSYNFQIFRFCFCNLRSLKPL